MKKLIAIIFILLSLPSLGYGLDEILYDNYLMFDVAELPKEYTITIDGVDYQMDWKRLLILTAGIESNFGRDNYEGRVAKTYLQMEKESFDHYIKVAPTYKKIMEDKFGKLTLTDEQAMFGAYVFYISKLIHHSNWIDKYKHVFYESNKDVEYFVYKIYFNSIKGASTYNKWCERQEQFMNISNKSIWI